jgi:hypothetical protein
VNWRVVSVDVVRAPRQYSVDCSSIEHLSFDTVQLEVNLYVCRPDDGVYKDAETCSHVIFNF